MALDYGELRAGDPAIPSPLRPLFLFIWKALKKIKALDWLTGGSGITITNNGDGTVTIAATGLFGTGSAGRVAYWSSANALSFDDLYWDATNNRLGIGDAASSPVGDLHVARNATGPTITLESTSSAASAGPVVNIKTPSTATSSGPSVQFSFGANVAAIGYSGVTGGLTFNRSTGLGQPGIIFCPNSSVRVRIGEVNTTPETTLHVIGSASGADIATLSENTFTPSATSNAGFKARVAGASAGDPYLQLIINLIRTWTIAADNDDSDSLVIGDSATPGASVKMRIATGGQVRILGGQSSSYGGVGCALSVNTTTVGNVGTGEDDLMSYSVPASALATNGDSLRMVAGGTFAASANNKRLRVKFGATTIFDSGSLAISAATDWALEVDVIRTGATSQKCVSRLNTSSGTLSASCDYATASETLSGAVTLKVTGEATDNDDIVQEMMRVNWESAP